MVDSLGDRIKAYESVPSLKLVRRTPVIIRLDGKTFHNWVKKAKCNNPTKNRKRKPYKRKHQNGIL